MPTQGHQQRRTFFAPNHWFVEQHPAYSKWAVPFWSICSLHLPRGHRFEIIASTERPIVSPENTNRCVLISLKRPKGDLQFQSGRMINRVADLGRLRITVVTGPFFSIRTGIMFSHPIFQWR